MNRNLIKHFTTLKQANKTKEYLVSSYSKAQGNDY